VSGTFEPDAQTTTLRCLRTRSVIASSSRLEQPCPPASRSTILCLFAVTTASGVEHCCTPASSRPDLGSNARSTTYLSVTDERNGASCIHAAIVRVHHTTPVFSRRLRRPQNVHWLVPDLVGGVIGQPLVGTCADPNLCKNLLGRNLLTLGTQSTFKIGAIVYRSVILNLTPMDEIRSESRYITISITRI